MAEYIEREAMRKLFCEWCNEEMAEEPCEPSECHAREIIMSVPAADVAPVVHGRWEFIGDDYANCTNCGQIFETRPSPYFFAMNNDFCRKCGARMDGE